MITIAKLKKIDFCTSFPSFSSSPPKNLINLLKNPATKEINQLIGQHPVADQ